MLLETDSIDGFKEVRIWGTLGWHDIRQRYRRSVIGPFWFTLSTAIMVVVLGGLYSQLLHQNIDDYLPYLAVGLIVWQFLASCIIEGTSSLISMAYLIKQIKLPFTIYICREVWRNFIILLHSLPVAIILLVVFGHWPKLSFLLLPLGLLLLALNGVWIGIVLGILCARFRDISPIVANLTQVIFFLTPVMWSPDILKDRAWMVDLNPFHHLIEIVRAPIIGSPIYWQSWAWSIAICVFGLIFAHFLMLRYRNRIAYWI